MAEMMTSADLYGDHRQHTFNTFRATNQTLARALKKSMDYRKHGGNAWVYGKPGSGKTHLGCAIVRDYLQHDKSAVFAKIGPLLDALREDYMSRVVLKETKWAKCELLVLDDLGMERTTDRMLERLTMLIDERATHHRSVVTTSNCEPQELHEQLSERLLSRLTAEPCTLIYTGAEDWRAKRK